MVGEVAPGGADAEAGIADVDDRVDGLLVWIVCAMVPHE